MFLANISKALFHCLFLQFSFLSFGQADTTSCTKHADCKMICEMQDISKYYQLDRPENLRVNPYWVPVCEDEGSNKSCKCKVWYRDVYTGIKCDPDSFVNTGEPCTQYCNSMKPQGVGVATRCGILEECTCMWTHLDLSLTDLKVPFE